MRREDGSIYRIGVWHCLTLSQLRSPAANPILTFADVAIGLGLEKNSYSHVDFPPPVKFSRDPAFGEHRTCMRYRVEGDECWSGRAKTCVTFPRPFLDNCSC